ncbi:MAG: hypothetical protein WC557_02860 [Ignavibacteriaceae bacterium]
MSETTILFARPSFWEGMARVLDLGNTVNSYNVSKSENEADARAIAADWHTILQDYNDTFETVIKEKDVKQPSEQE